MTTNALKDAATVLVGSTIDCDNDPAWCDCAWHENMHRAEESHHIEGDQLSIAGIPPPPPPEAYLVAQLREAHTILSRLSVSFDRKLPQNVYLAMSYLHIEIVTRTRSAGGAK